MTRIVRSRWCFDKTEVVARDGMVAAGKIQAAEAGIDMLLQGGNAVDAAVAAGFAVSVVEPWMNGIGGSGAMVVHQDGEDTAIEFGIRAPLAARPDMYELDSAGVGSFGWAGVRDRANELGHQSVGVPGLVAGHCLAHERFGRLPLRTVLEPAIHLAEAGFETDWHTTLTVAIHLECLGHFPATAQVYLPDGMAVPKPEFRFLPADRIVQRDLADTLRQIARHGSDAFYRGEVAAAIAEDMAANGGLLTVEDLWRYEPMVYPGGLRGTYRDVVLVGVPGATGGPLLQEILNILEGYDLAGLGRDSAATLHLLAAACGWAYTDHFRYATASVHELPVPWAGLISKAYAGAIRSALQRRTGGPSTDRPDPWDFDSGEGFDGALARATPSQGGALHTTHVCAVDRDHNAVTATQTLGLLFGSNVTVPGTGVLLNDMMAVFDPQPGNVHSIVSGGSQAAPYTPTVLLRDGRLLGAVGAPGGRRIPTAIAQVISNLVDHKMGIQASITAPRLHSESGRVEVDDRIPESVISELAALGHDVITAEKTVCSYNFANPVAIIVAADGTLAGGTDPLLPGAAVGLFSVDA